MPVCQKTEEAFEKHPDVTVVVNFAPFRSARLATETLSCSDQIKTIAIIAEGAPESQTRALSKKAHKEGVGVIGPATAGGAKARPEQLNC